jgi:alkylation response protein AidB-like acyl-CoA dehydrogenase
LSLAQTSSSAGVEIPPLDPTVTPEELVRRATAMRDALRERQAACEQAGRILKETNEEFVQAGFYRILQPRCFGASVSVGMARGALDIYEEILRGKRVAFPPFQYRYQEPEYQRHFGEAQSLIDTAEAALLKMGEDYLQYAARLANEGAPFSDELERRFLLIEQQCVRLAWDAIELMFRTSGSSSGAKSAVLGRYFRNLAVIRTHLTLQLDHTAGNAARLHFALPPLSRL